MTRQELDMFLALINNPKFIISSLLAIGGLVAVFYLWQKGLTIFLSGIIFNIVFAEILLLKPRFGLFPFFVLLIVLVLLLAIDLRIGYEKHLMLQLLHSLLLIITCLYMALFLVISFGTFFGELKIVVISNMEGVGSSSDQYLIVNAINRYKWPTHKIVWESAQMFFLNSRESYNIDTNYVNAVNSFVEKVLKDSFIQWEAENFAAPWPIRQGSDLYNRMLDTYVLFNTRSGQFTTEAEAIDSFANEFIKKFNIDHRRVRNIWSFLDRKLSTENLYMSLRINTNSGDCLSLVVGSSKSISQRQFIHVSPYVAHILQAAITYQTTGIISFPDFIGLLNLLSGSIKPSNFTYGAALFQFYGKIKLYYTFWFLLILLYFFTRLYKKLSDILPKSAVGVPLQEYMEYTDDDDDIKK